MNHRLPIWPCCAAVALAGCPEVEGPNDASTPIDSADAAVADAGRHDALRHDASRSDARPPTDAAIDWQDGGARGQFATATFALPLDYADPGAGTVDVVVQRSLPSSGVVRGQAFLLQGGPGSRSVGTMAGQSAVFRRYDLAAYLVDQRGVFGPQAPPVCSELDAADWSDMEATRAATAACLATVDSTTLQHLSAANQGRDLGEIIARVRSGNLPIFVYGISYGTRWALRYLQQFPDQATGVILDSLLAEEIDWSLGIGRTHDAAIRWLFEQCGADTFCASKLGVDAVQRFRDVLDSATTGHCPTALNINADSYRSLFDLAYTTGAATRPLVAALAYRVGRCSAADQIAIANLATNLGGGATSSDAFNSVVHLEVVTSELMPDPPPSFDDITAWEASALLPISGPRGYRTIWELWPRYPHDSWQGHYPTTDVPVLMLHGTADGNLPYSGAQTVAAALAGPHQQLVTFVGAAHGLLNNTLIAVGPPFIDCAESIIADFVADPAATLDTSCASALPPLDFSLVSQQAAVERLFGVSDAWE